MKIAVYTIALNEEKHIDMWYQSAREADVLLIADTGSTDGTVAICKELRIQCPEIRVKPWRFDDARNAALAFLPGDVDFCVVLDADERLAPGWRSEVERCFTLGATRMRYRYVHSHNEDGSDGLQFMRDGAHARHGYRWTHPVHEVLKADRITEKVVESTLAVHHYQDSSKSRKDYLPLLAQSVKERPGDDRNTHYYARELMYYQRFTEAADFFKTHLAMPTSRWPAERAQSMRFLAKCEPENAESWLLDSIKEAPGRREALVDLAYLYYQSGIWDRCLDAAERALAITERPLDYLCDSLAWGDRPYDLAAISCFHLKKYDLALNLGKLAEAHNRLDPRLKDNVAQYEKAARLHSAESDKMSY